MNAFTSALADEMARARAALADARARHDDEATDEALGRLLDLRDIGASVREA